MEDLARVWTFSRYNRASSLVLPASGRELLELNIQKGLDRPAIKCPAPSKRLIHSGCLRHPLKDVGLHSSLGLAGRRAPTLANWT